MGLTTADTAYRYDGTSWSAPLAVSGGGPAPSPPAAELSCTGPTFCWAVPGGNEVVMWNGTSWTSAQTIAGAQGLQAMACAAGGVCVTIDGEGDAYFYSGRWESAVNAWGGPTAISCVNATFCMATAGGTAQWNGRSWSQPQDVDTAGQLDAVSCASTSFCVAADTVGNILAWNGSSWSVPQPVDPSNGTGGVGSNELTSVSCAGTTFCAAVDSSGQGPDLQRHRPGRRRRTSTATRHWWRSPAPTPTLCLAVDRQGRVLTYLPLVDARCGVRACRGRPTRRWPRPRRLR